MGVNINHLIEDGEVQVDTYSIAHLNQRELETLQSLDGIEKLTKLTYLDLSRSSLKSLNGIEKCKTINTLKILSCPIMDFSPLIDTKIESLYVSANEKSNMFNVIERMKNIKTLYVTNCVSSTLTQIKNETLQTLSIVTAVGNLIDFSDFEHIIENNRNLSGLELNLEMNTCTPSTKAKLQSMLHSGKKLDYLDKYELYEIVKRCIYTELHLKPEDDLRGAASIMDTGLFDFKV